MSRAELARRIKKKPEQITRWLNTPGNLSLSTLSDLLLGICFSELKDEVASLRKPPRNFDRPTWIGQEAPWPTTRYEDVPPFLPPERTQEPTTDLAKQLVSA